MKNESQLHHIQKSIILSLAKKSPLRFSELQPPRIPNNTFSYHLKKLLETGYIDSTTKGYTATRKALKLINFGVSREKTITSPNILSMLFIVNDDDEILLINRNNKPFQGWYSLPSGLIHLGETLSEAARRELYEKTRLKETTDLNNVGVLDFRYVEQETQDIFVHAIAFVYYLRYRGNKSKLDDVETIYGQLSWSKLGRSHILPEVLAVKEIVDAGRFARVSVSFEEPSQIPVFTN